MSNTVSYITVSIAFIWLSCGPSLVEKEGAGLSAVPMHGCHSVSGDELRGADCPATYYPSKWDRSPMGPGHMHCETVYDRGLAKQGWKEQYWFVAPSDVHNWVQHCPNGQCWNDHNNGLCGRRVKLKCRENCRSDGPKYAVGMIMDFCPKEHKDRINDESPCSKTQAWDISVHIRDGFKLRDDNVRVDYELLSVGSEESLGFHW